MEDKTFELLEKMYSEFLGFKRDTTERLERIEVKQSKMEIIQEKMSKDIKIIAEVQANHIDQNERQHREIMGVIDNKTSLQRKRWDI